MQASLERLRRRREDLEDEGGFTLIELLIVIVILGILAAIVVFAVQNLSGQSSQAACNSDYKTVEAAVESYNAQLGAYPGGTLVPGWKQSAAPVIPPPTGMTAAISGDDTPLMSTYTLGTQTVGPWLKDWPYNNGHYQIGIDNTAAATGNVTVYDPGGVAETGGTGQAGCTSVK